eukprot:854181-Karenia_brevis.AAC.1
MQDIKVYLPYGLPKVVEKPLFTQIAVDAVDDCTSLIPAHLHHIDIVKQIRRLQDLVRHLQKHTSSSSSIHQH